MARPLQREKACLGVHHRHQGMLRQHRVVSELQVSMVLRLSQAGHSSMRPQSTCQHRTLDCLTLQRNLIPTFRTRAGARSSRSVRATPAVRRAASAPLGAPLTVGYRSDANPRPRKKRKLRAKKADRRRAVANAPRYGSGIEAEKQGASGVGFCSAANAILLFSMFDTPDKQLLSSTKLMLMR